MWSYKQKDILYTPGEYIIHVFGGVRETARQLGHDPTNVSRWQKKRELPRSVMKKILMIAQERGLDITPHDLIFGRVVRED